MFELAYSEIILRLILAVLFGSAIGYEREIKGHDAGLRTHILVCVGACIITLVQLQVTYSTIEMALSEPDLTQVLNTDMTRIPAQIISGIGFLGAGTIIVTKKSVTGLTTAASIWAIAGLGIAVGMGSYFLALIGCLIILLVLRVIKKLFRVQSSKRIEIYYINHEETKQFLNSYFTKMKINILGLDYSVDTKSAEKNSYINLYTLSLPDTKSIASVVEDLSEFKNIQRIQTLREN
ncbi:MgtC/SapB family protein [Carnobacterium pleistocenium]|uniref:MgtC/SapB family protein n=1 Tax=Carnobacterium pleistocenium TaxID=181073 RepID=UPI000550ED7C|nr:MgtC/SapB family protein [Carnobacterium pleistocenium]